jgi:hypothetical protein
LGFAHWPSPGCCGSGSIEAGENQVIEKFDKIIIGAGIYGLYAALRSGQKKEKVLVIECDAQPFSRATYINQARVHNGYHYPRSFSTAIKSAGYFRRFTDDFGFAIVDSFSKIYAIAADFSWTSASQFAAFCKNANVKCEEILPHDIFKKNSIAGAFLTEEYAFDAKRIRDYFLEKLAALPQVEIRYASKISARDVKGSEYYLTVNNTVVASGYILNATYASTNQIAHLFGFEKFKIKYEICEIILCEVSQNIKNVGVTVMDGPFFSVMPFGLDGLHSLTSVAFTPHTTSYADLPQFHCQCGVDCSCVQLANCNVCKNRPQTAWHYMHALSKKFLTDEVCMDYKESLFAIKPILTASEIDDSRPTVIKSFSQAPYFYSVLSGKINTIYDLDAIL